jgi:hypothetical protein
MKCLVHRVSLCTASPGEDILGSRDRNPVGPKSNNVAAQMDVLCGRNCEIISSQCDFGMSVKAARHSLVGINDVGACPSWSKIII